MTCGIREEEQIYDQVASFKEKIFIMRVSLRAGNTVPINGVRNFN